MNKKTKTNKKNNIKKQKIQFWHIDYDYDNVSEIIRLANKSTPDDVCSELTDDTRLLCFSL